MEILSKIILGFYSATRWMEFGFWPSLYIMAVCLLGANGLYYITFLIEQPIKSPEERKRHNKSFWWIFFGQIMYAFFGLSMIYINNTAVTGGVYAVFFLYYLAAGFIIIATCTNLIDRLVRRKTGHK